MTELNIENVDRIFSDCMFRSHEEYGECKKEGLHVFVHSIQNPTVKVGFHPERIEVHRHEIREMLSQLPDGFFPGQAMEPLSFRRAPPKTGSYGPDFIQRRKSFVCWE